MYCTIQHAICKTKQAKKEPMRRNDGGNFASLKGPPKKNTPKNKKLINDETRFSLRTLLSETGATFFISQNPTDYLSEGQGRGGGRGGRFLPIYPKSPKSSSFPLAGVFFFFFDFSDDMNPKIPFFIIIIAIFVVQK